MVSLMLIRPAEIGIGKGEISRFVQSDKFREILTWTVPPVTPLLRYAIDKKDVFDKKDERPDLFDKQKKLLKRDLVRDITIYSIGTVMYFASLVGINRVLKKTTKITEKNRKLAAFLGALAINIAYVSVGASKLSKLILKKRQKTEPMPEEYLYAQKLDTLKSSPLLQNNPYFKARIQEKRD